MLYIVPHAVDVDAELRKARAVVASGPSSLRCLINGAAFEVKRRDSLDVVRGRYAKAARR